VAEKAADISDVLDKVSFQLVTDLLDPNPETEVREISIEDIFKYDFNDIKCNETSSLSQLMDIPT